ncbi:E3 ubiquitin-protein ligase listerin [Biomphalaria pfeifferi]|uniref:E3 ubiquitin-protein ligase listerin n=1 Tax=Biomphalaria pfeifferi TaxID=112525 RepID=A0AAD8BLC4_BIOPF|nr:E3 ubiquitin-protein ligase listerin [Biomphalaria pfeifferi]
MPGPKKAPRSKGNVKPSSSSQAAQLLEASGFTNTGFIGFSKEPVFVPASEIFDDAEAALDGDIRLVLRKFSKRDNVTKIKALQEFMSLCSSKNVELIKAVIPFWTRIYNKLAIDVDHKVRELTQRALLVLAEKTGKCIAPQLKNIMGIWLVSMCDTYPTVASAANNAFTSTFNTQKQAEALIFCRAEALECLMNNILKATPQTLSDTQTTSEEDMQSKFERVVSSSLLALRKLIMSLPPDTVALSLNEQLTTLLASLAFWKHTKSSVSLIKSATLSLLSAVCQRCCSVSASAISKIAPFVVSNLDSTEPIMLTYTWEATLSMINAHEDCWTYINWQKAVWPKIKHILETGCCGHAGIVSPCLLPLLSKIPNPNYRQFFDSFRTGLCETKTVQSPSDINVLVRSFTECIHYSVKHSFEVGNDSSTIEDLVLHQFLLVVEASLLEQHVVLSKTDIFISLASLMELVENISPKTASQFWIELAAFVSERFDLEYLAAVEKKIDFASSPQTPHIFYSVVLLMQGLVFREAASGVKERVRFTQEETRKTTLKKSNLTKTKCKLCPSMESFIKDVFIQVFTLAAASQKAFQLYMNLLKDMSSIHIPILAVQQLNKSVTLDPAQHFPEQSVEHSTQTLFPSGDEYLNFVFQKLVKTLLLVSKGDFPDSKVETKFTENLILTILYTLCYVEHGEGTKVLLFILDNLGDVGMKCQFIEHLFGCIESISSCKNSLNNSQLLECLRCVTNETLNKADANNHLKMCAWKMLSAVLDSLDLCTYEIFTNSSIDIVMSGVLTTQKQLLQSNNSSSNDAMLFITHVVKKLLARKEVWTQVHLGELVLNFISLLLTLENEDLISEIKIVWLQGFSLIIEKKSDAEIQAHIKSMSVLIKKKLLTKHKIYSCLPLIKNIISSSVQLVATGQTNSQSSLDIELDKSALSNIIDVFLIKDNSQVETFREVCNYYYLSNMLPYFPCGSTSVSSTSTTLDTYAILSIHNTETITLYRNMNNSGVQHSEIQWSRIQLQCLIELSHRLLLLEGIMTTNPLALKNFDCDLVEMKQNLLRCLKSLSKEHLTALVSLVLERTGEDWATYCYGLQLLLELIAKDEDHPELEKELLSLKGYFLTRLGLSEIKEKLSNISEESLSDALANSLKTLLDKQDINVADLADNFSGWLTMATDYNILSDRMKESFFHHIVDAVKLLKTQNIQLLSGGDTNASVKDLHWNIQVSRSLRVIALPGNPKYWEFTLCSLVEWIQFLLENQVNQSSDYGIKSLLVSVGYLSYLAADTFSAQSSIVTANSKTEWEEFFSEAVFSPLLQIFVSLCADNVNDLNPCWTLVLESVASVISLCPAWIMLAHQLPARLTTTDMSSLPDNVKTLLNHISPLLTFRLRSVEVSAYLLLWKILDELPKHDSGLDEEDKQNEETSSPPEALIKVIESSGHFLSFLKVIQIDDHIVLDRDTDEYAQTLGYLLAWKLVLQLFKLSTNQMRAKYAQYFKVNNSVNCLLDNLFRLMPQHPAASILNFDCPVEVKAEVNDTELAWFSLCVYRQCLEILPALVRSWWVDQDRKAANFIDRFTSEYLSAGLIRQQILAAQNVDKGMEEITIRARPAAREVLATYTMSEVTINMSILLPENYPLGKLEVTCDKRVGVSQAQWDRWLLQLNIFLQHQNGSIVEGLRLWKGNIDKKFEGIEDCMICFSVIHGTTFQLPRLTCRTCRKKFHSACLYKWFSTSQKSSCPLCRNLF